MHVPELPLLVGTVCGVVRGHGVAMHLQRIVHEAKADLAGRDEAGHHVGLVQGGEVAAARALEIGEFHDLDERIRAPGHDAGGRDGRVGGVELDHLRRA